MIVDNLIIFRTGVKIEGSHAVVVGRSKIVGTPNAEVLKWHDATVTICHTKTENLPQIVIDHSLKYINIFFLLSILP